MKKLLRRWLDTVLGLLLLPIILFEEWGWDALLALAARIASWLRLEALQRRIAALPPYGALAVLLLPSLLLVPLKLLGLWMLTRGLVLWSLLLVVVSKLAGTAVLAQLFTLTKPQLMKIGWFARGYARWTAWKNRWLDALHATAAWQAARRVRQAALAWMRRVWRR